MSGTHDIRLSAYHRSPICLTIIQMDLLTDRSQSIGDRFVSIVEGMQMNNDPLFFQCDQFIEYIDRSAILRWIRKVECYDM